GAQRSAAVDGQQAARQAGREVQARRIGQLLRVELCVERVGGILLKVHVGIVRQAAARPGKGELHEGPGFGRAVVGGVGVGSYPVRVAEREGAAGLARAHAGEERLAHCQHWVAAAY
nr:hypothetical protein [Tanacetum cinerariifolium]